MPRVDGHLRVKDGERRLVEWVAHAKVGDRIPAPWNTASNPHESIIRTLAELGVIPPPRPGADRAAIAREAAGAARAWLERHPPRGEIDGPPARAEAPRPR